MVRERFPDGRMLLAVYHNSSRKKYYTAKFILIISWHVKTIFDRDHWARESHNSRVHRDSKWINEGKLVSEKRVLSASSREMCCNRALRMHMRRETRSWMACNHWQVWLLNVDISSDGESSNKNPETSLRVSLVEINKVNCLRTKLRQRFIRTGRAMSRLILIIFLRFRGVSCIIGNIFIYFRWRTWCKQPLEMAPASIRISQNRM